MRDTKRVAMLMLLGLVSCTDAECSSFSTLGESGHIKCYSGGVVIYEGDSTGTIANEHQSDGYYFRDKATNRMVGVSGQCVITF